jgi:hypothetical protein
LTSPAVLLETLPKEEAPALPTERKVEVAAHRERVVAEFRGEHQVPAHGTRATTFCP